MNPRRSKRFSHARAPQARQTTERQEQIEKSLSAIFRDESGALPNLTSVSPRRTSRVFLILGGCAAGALLLTGVAWAGFFIFQPFRIVQNQGLSLSVDGPTHVTLGQETAYVVRWKNSAAGALAAADVRVSFPSDFAPTALEPPPTQQGFVWHLGAIERNASGEIRIRGVFSGALGTKTALQIVGTYRPTSVNSDFETLTSLPLAYTRTVLEGSLEIPQKTLPGDQINVAYTIVNTGTDSLKNLEMRVALPLSFVHIASSTGSAVDERVARMLLGELPAGASNTLAIVGSFASGAAAEAVFHAETGQLNRDGTWQPMQKNDFTVSVLSGDLLVKLVVNGSDASRSIGADEKLHIALGYENTAPEDMRDVSLRLLFEPIHTTTTPSVKRDAAPQIIDWSKLTDAASGTRRGNVLTWDHVAIGALKRLPPRQDGTIELTIPAPSSWDAADFQIIAEAVFTSIGGNAVNRVIRTAPIIFRFRTDAEVTAEARYFSEDGVPLGSGPLPPLVNQPTVYRIGWVVRKHTHELKHLRATATLPKRVAWTKKILTTAGEMAYDESARVVSWTLNRLPRDVDEARATFDVQLTPSEFDVGRFADLVGDMRAEFTDADINEHITRATPALTTDLQQDEGARSKGVVRKP